MATWPVQGRRRVGGWRRHAPCRRARCRRSAGPPAPAPTPRRRPARRGGGACRVSSTRALGTERAAGYAAQARPPRTSLRVVPSSAGCSSATGTRLALRRARVRYSSGPWGAAQGGAGACGARRGRAHSIESIQYIGLRLLEGSCTSLRFRSCRGTRTRRKGQHGCSQGRCPWGASGGGQARAPCALRGGGSRAPLAADGR